MTGRIGAGRAGGQHGMTIVELMVAMVILGIVIAAAFSVAFSIMSSYREHRRAMGVERSTRGAMAVLVDAVRNASPGVPSGAIVDLIGCETSALAPPGSWPGIKVDNHSNAPDAIDLVYASGGVVTSLRTAFTNTSTQIVVEDGSLLLPGDQVLVTNFDRGHLLEIVNRTHTPPDWNLILAAAPQALCGTPPAPFTYPARSTVMRVQKARFSVDAAGGVPVLYMDRDGPALSSDPPEAVAEGVEDLQIAIGVDIDGNGAIDAENGAAANDDEWVYNNAGDSSPPRIDTRPYRAIRVTVIGRSVNDTSTVPISLRPPAEDHPGATVADEFLRRSLSTTVEIRNLKGSP